jgi:hypothetical protein
MSVQAADTYPATAELIAKDANDDVGERFGIVGEDATVDRLADVGAGAGWRGIAGTQDDVAGLTQPSCGSGWHCMS